MASWTDGAAYAPIERPDGFATPEVAALEVAEPVAASTPGPLPPPAGFSPVRSAVRLEDVGAGTTVTRDPSEPFVVSGGLLTMGSSMGARSRRDPKAPFAVTSAAPAPPPSTVPKDFPPPTGAPLPLPGPLPRALAVRRTQQDASQRMLVFVAMAGMVMGMAIAAVAPWMLIVAGALALRTVRITGRVGSWALGTGLALLFVSTLGPAGALDAIARVTCLGFVIAMGIGVARGGTRR